MTTKYFEDLNKFHQHFGFRQPKSLTRLKRDLHEFRYNFLNEEFQEYVDSYNTNDLATAVDSLIDLVYIACGSLWFHGMTKEKFNAWEITSFQEQFDFETTSLSKDKLSFQSKEIHEQFIAIIKSNIEVYNKAYYGSKFSISIDSLMQIYMNCFFMMSLMGMTEECINDFWDDVQRANMSKIRAERNLDSKRGSAKFDIIKPNSWKAPLSDELTKKWTQ